MRMAVWGVTDDVLFFEKLGSLMGLTFIYAILSAILYKKIDRHVRISATLEVA
jgi:ABC-2 type transport system permease protein